jgi:hypothetical protein
VIKATIAGLCAARVLLGFYDPAAHPERDELPSTPPNRTAIPQSQHVRLLMPYGAMEFDALFPSSGLITA